MSEKNNVVLLPAKPEEYEVFIQKLRESFSVALIEEFGNSDSLPSNEDILSSMNKKDAEVFHIVANNECVGGVVLAIDKVTNYNSLELFFISPEYHSKGFGLASWKAIESKYPDTIVWTTITPYFEKRNIHFYVNKCGFHIVEFFNKKHIDLENLSSDNHNEAPAPGMDEYFRFEKIMK